MKIRPSKSKPPQGRQRQRPVTTDHAQAPTAYSYHAQRANRPESPERQQASLASKRSRLLSLRFWFRRSSYLMIGFVILVLLFGLLHVSTNPKVVLLEDGNTYAFKDNKHYQDAIKQQLQSSVWNHNKLTINTGGISKQLQLANPELANVAITLPLIGWRPIYYLQASDPAYVVQSVNGTYVLDSNGKALAARDKVPEAIVTNLPTLTDQTGVRISVGKQAISSNNADFIRTVAQTLKAQGVVVDALLLPANTVQELDVRVVGSAYVIKFDMHQSGGARQQVGTYLAIKKQLDSQTKTPGQYIDVRVLGRAYYL